MVKKSSELKFSSRPTLVILQQTTQSAPCNVSLRRFASLLVAGVTETEVRAFTLVIVLPELVLRVLVEGKFQGRRGWAGSYLL
jgi:dihydroxyacid dehydratase/phosphogluconate dehydratase